MKKERKEIKKQKGDEDSIPLENPNEKFAVEILIKRWITM